MLLTRLLLGTLLATVVSVWAARRRALTRAGAIVAAVTGTVSAAAGWPWCAALLTFFFAALLAERLARPASRSSLEIVAKSGIRDGAQVLANGGPFACCALLAVWNPSVALWIAGVSSLAAAAGDTLGTTIGQAYGGAPRSLRGWRVVPTGTSGAVSWAGLLGTAVGALLVTMVSAPWTRSIRLSLTIFGAGVTGALVDSVLGATIQERRWCPRCALETEQPLHRCGVATERIGGTRLNNDGVNLTSVTIAALLGALGWRVFR